MSFQAPGTFVSSSVQFCRMSESPFGKWDEENFREPWFSQGLLEVITVGKALIPGGLWCALSLHMHAADMGADADGDLLQDAF